MIYSLVATNLGSLIVIGYLIRSTSAERRILWASTLEAAGKTDAARRASGPTHDESKEMVDRQLKLMAEAKDNGGVFAGNPYASPPKPVGV